MLRSNASGAYNIGTGRGYALRDVVTQLAQKLDASNCLMFDARAMRSGDPDCLIADMSKVESLLGPRNLVSLEAGLQLVIESLARKN